MKFFTETKVIEIEKGRKLEPLTSEMRESLKTLQHNIAFQYLLNKLHHQKARVQQHLNNDADEKGMRYAQAGIYWLSWLETEVNALTKNPTPPARQANVDELEAYNKIASSLEVVGAN